MKITLLDYGAGNVRSIRNAITKLGFEIEEITDPSMIESAERLVFPGVGSFGLAMEQLRLRGYMEPLRRRILADKPFLGICIAMQSLYAGSEESPEAEGLGIIPGTIRRFTTEKLVVPAIGWSGVRPVKESFLFHGWNGEKLYFVHSYHAPVAETPEEWVLAESDYDGTFVSAVSRGRVSAVQFHPEKSGTAGLNILNNYLCDQQQAAALQVESRPATMARRIIACLDVRSNDTGDLVVTKGDQYDVRDGAGGEVRNLGKPVALARRYFEEGADEVTFLNITGYRNSPLRDQPMLDLLKETSKNVFVPLTIGGGIRGFVDSEGGEHSALDVAAAYFRAGADKVSIGSDSVAAAEEYLATGVKTGKSSIEQISHVYGAQAVVISVDPRRVYVADPAGSGHALVETTIPGPNGEKFCWFQCTVSGGREGRDFDVVQLVTACEALGAGEILLNCIDRDGTGDGFDLELIRQVKDAVSIPVIASSGAGCATHFAEVFQQTEADAALAAGIFHRREVGIDEVKEVVRAAGLEVR